MTHDELKELVPIFALDALPAEDEVELTAHLKFCTECSELLAEHRETAGMLAVAVGSVEAPRDLKQRILAEAARTPQLHAAPSPAASRPSVRHARRWQWVALAGTCVIALLVGGLAFREFGEQTPSQQEILLDRQKQALSIISSPNSVVLPMSTNEEFPQAYGKAFVSDKDGKAAVIVSGLEEPGDDVYTLWLIAEGDRKPVTDFDVDEGSQTILVDREVGSDATLAVTREPNPGNTSPQGPVVMSTYRA
jgi:hypothetical protein